MNAKKVTVEVYGADVICASCVNAPTSKDTYEWLDAAIQRKYPNHPFEIVYIDIESDIKDARQRQLAEQVKDEEYFYPLVIVNEEVIGEGYIQLKPIYNELEKHGFISAM
ncbi:YuzD family protein [Sporosarcina aquimarina]|uniref:YuzD family protein n=1 Tax=Sporosarcina aquimarina TaxID=114975 RepID=A0ABU4G3S8_9BACL|nr:YuzD family protein [Sporosarcina aquimarina]MDW0110963.1 YuzD family protein [Sporosarcina aquimarina]